MSINTLHKGDDDDDDDDDNNNNSTGVFLYFICEKSVSMAVVTIYNKRNASRDTGHGVAIFSTIPQNTIVVSRTSP